MPGLKRPCLGLSDSTTFKTPRLIDCTNIMRPTNRNGAVHFSGLKTPCKDSSVSSDKSKFKTTFRDRTNIMKETIVGSESYVAPMKTPYKKSNITSDVTHFKTPAQLTKSLHHTSPSQFSSKFTVTPLKNGTPLLRYNAGSVTPPLCDCGRRSRRLTVSKIGPNQGRVFYTCSVKKSRSSFGKSPLSVNKSKSGCKFFCWEPSAM